MSSQSSTGGNVLGFIGAVVGFVATGGNPLGAAQGYAIGSSIGNVLDPPKGPTVSGPRLSDLTVQTSTYGAFLPRFYGTVPVHGNIFWLEGGRLKEVVRKQRQGGKGGGGGAKTKTYTYFATFAIGLGEGPIAAVRRIWCRDKLIYNAGSDDLETIIASNNAASGFRIYTGADDQLPDPRIESEKGVGNTPAYRGTAYIVFDDFELTEYNNSLEGAQFKFELVSSSNPDPKVVLSVTHPYQYPRDDLFFLPRVYYITPERVVFYAAQWDATYPPSSSYIRYDFRLGAAPITTIHPVSVQSGDSPPNGDFDDPELFFNDASDIFDVGRPFDLTTGYIQLRNKMFAGLDSSGGKRIYLKSISDGIVYDVSVSSSASCFAITGNGLLVIESGSIKEYDNQLSIVNEYFLTNPLTVYPNARAEIVNGHLFLYDGDPDATVYKYSTDFSSYEIFASLPDIGIGSYEGLSVAISEALIVRGVGRPALVEKTMHIQYFNPAADLTNKIPLGDIVKSEISLSSLLNETDVSSAALTSEVRGYRVQGGSIRAALENLQSVFPFDVRQHGYQLECVPRGGSSVVTIPYEDLGDQPESALRQAREMDSQLPASTHIKFWDASREYANGEEYADRPGTSSINRVDREVPIVLTATEAARAADVLQQLAWLERTSFEFDLPPIYGELEPSDVVTVTTPDSIYSLRLTEINDAASLVRRCKAKPANAAIYNSAAIGGEGNNPPQTIVLAGPSLFLPLDIPLVDEVSQVNPGFVGAMTGFNQGWPGAIAIRSSDGAQTFEDIQAFPGKSTIAIAQDSLASHQGYLINQDSLTLSVISGQFESVTNEQLLTGFNYAAYGVDGRWEIVRFMDATLNPDDTYTLSGFVRGDKGTEWTTGLHQIGDYFVLLDDPDNAFIGMQIQSIGLDRIYRGVTVGADIGSAIDVDFSYDGINLEPLSAVDVSGQRDGSQNFTGSFYRRSRLSSTWWTNGIQAPVGETTESYEIDVMNGSTVVRTISVSTTTFSYSAANQTTDFGSPQASITFRIYQLSEIVGRGYVREVTL